MTATRRWTVWTRTVTYEKRYVEAEIPQEAAHIAMDDDAPEPAYTMVDIVPLDVSEGNDYRPDAVAAFDPRYDNPPTAT